MPVCDPRKQIAPQSTNGPQNLRDRTACKAFQTETALIGDPHSHPVVMRIVDGAEGGCLDWRFSFETFEFEDDGEIIESGHLEVPSVTQRGSEPSSNINIAEDRREGGIAFDAAKDVERLLHPIGPRH